MDRLKRAPMGAGERFGRVSERGQLKPHESVNVPPRPVFYKYDMALTARHVGFSRRISEGRENRHPLSTDSGRNVIAIALTCETCVLERLSSGA